METASSTSTASEGDSIKIFLRVRPPDSSTSENDFAPRVLDVNTQDNAIILRTKPEPKIFTYDNVADADITQETVFSIVGKKIIESCVAGYNGTIFAYGQTGSGKTFTMLGPSENADSFQHELRGVIPRSFEYLFNLIAHQTELHGSKKQFLCRCSFLEIYQEQIFDLLDPTSQGLHLRENMNKGVFVDGLVEEVIDNPSDAYQVLITGWLNRRVAATSMNRESSRSHAVFTVTIESKEEECGVQNIRTSQLNLVDLAGSERQKDTNTGGTRLKEAGSINKSLSVLGNVIMSLVELSNGKKRHVPYRDSKLTFLLRDSLGGNTKTHMVACVHPDSKCFQESLSTLNFARSAKLIKNKAVVNEDFHGNNQKLQNEIRRLKELLETHQNPVAPHPLLSLPAEVPESAMNSDSVWKRKFIEAMHFRETSEAEKKTLQDVVNHLQELCNKKDKYIQSTKMIIKFRENNIQSLQNQVQGHAQLEKDPVIISLKEEIVVLKQQLDHNPQLAKYAGENKYLRSELKRLRSQETVDAELRDNNRIAQLEKIFKELKLLHDLANGGSIKASVSSAATARSPVKESSSTANLERQAEKYRREMKCYQDQVEQLKNQVLEVTKTNENRQMEMEVELVSRGKMISELERVLEAHQLKARIEHNALKDLHCQTLKAWTSPKPSTDSPYGTPVSGNPVKQEVGSSPDAASSCHPTASELAEGARDALMDEIQSLQAENGRLKKSVDVFEADMLRVNQKVEKLELYNSQLSGVMEKERSEAKAATTEHHADVAALREEMDRLQGDLKLLGDENSDLYLVLKSTDKQLKEEKETIKLLRESTSERESGMEKRLGAAMLDLHRTTKEHEEALKELATLKEELETNRLTVSFHESTVQEVQVKIGQILKEKEKLEAECHQLRGQSSVSSQSYAEYKEEADRLLKHKQEELEAVRGDWDRERSQHSVVMDQNKCAMASLVHQLTELKSRLTSQTEHSAGLKVERDTYQQELGDVRRDHEVTATELSALQAEFRELKERTEQQMMAKDFELDNLQQDQDSLNSHLLRQEEIISDLQAKLDHTKEMCDSLQEMVDTYKKKLADKDQAMQELQCSTELRRLSSYDVNTTTPTRSQRLGADHDVMKPGFKTLDSVIKEYELSRKEKNTENEQLKAQIAELERSYKCLMMEKKEQEDAKTSLSITQTKDKEHIAMMEESVASKEEELSKAQRELRSLRIQVVDMREELFNYINTLDQSDRERKEYKQEVCRLQTTLESNQATTLEAKSMVEHLMEEKAKLAKEFTEVSARNKQLEEESAHLIGHKNHAQRIKLMEKKNAEYNELSRNGREIGSSPGELCLTNTGRSGNT